VRNQKAGSKFLFETGGGLQQYFPDLSCRQNGFAPYLESDDPKLASFEHLNLINATDLIFTVVRDPVATALAAFCEIDLRDPSPRSASNRTGVWLPVEKELPRKEYALQYQARYEAVSCERCPTCRYQAFLNGIQQKEPLSHEFFHAYPQSVKTHVVDAFDAIVKLEALEAGLAAIAGRVGTPFRPAVAPTKNQSHSHVVDATSCCSRVESGVRGSKPLLLRLCQMYWADFACFGYDLPAACKDLRCGPGSLLPPPPPPPQPPPPPPSPQPPPPSSQLTSPRT